MAKLQTPMRGSIGRCPKCASIKVRTGRTGGGVAPHFYAEILAICDNCKCIWEPINEALIWDRTDPECSFKDPCDNCAFRPGSPEQQDPVSWAELMAKLRAGATFHCHKGVPIDPAHPDGFLYPTKRSKLRLCRGFLNAWGQWAKKAHPADTESTPPADPA